MRPLLLSLLLAVAAAPAAEAAAKRSDLVVSRVAVPAAVAPGAALKIDLTTKNAGKAKSGRSATSLWLGKKGGTLLGKQTVKAVKSGETSAGALTVKAPGKPGTYTLVACADDGRKVSERNEANNCRSAKLVVRAATAPGPGSDPGPAPAPPSAPAPQPAPPAPPAEGANLQVADVSDPPASAREGGEFGVSDSTVSAGTAGTGASAVRFYLSPDPEESFKHRRESTEDPRRGLRDVRLGGSRDVAALGAGARSDAALPTRLTVPFGTRPGTYYLLACADDRAAVAEAVEDDNCRVATHPEGDVEKPTPIQILAEDVAYRVDAYSDIFGQPDEADDIDKLARMSPAFCANPAPGGATSLPGALDAIERMLDDTAPQGQAKFKASAEYQDAHKAEVAAGGAITMGSPGAALAALVRAHELEPTEASHLVNAAAVASSVGMPAEALALLDAAERLDDPDRPAMGIGRHAVALANRGQALAMLGRHAEADRALAAAVDAEPLLAEATKSRAATTACTAGPAPAAKFLRAGRQRQPPKPLDASRGKETKLRDLEIPGVPKEAAAMRPFFQGQSQKLQAELMDEINRANAREAAIAAKRPVWSPAQDRRYSATLIRIYDAGEEADIRALDEAVDAKLDEVIKIQRDFWGDNEREDYEYRLLSEAAGKWCEGSPNPRCFPERMNETCRPKLRIAHQAWRDELQETYAAAQTLTRAASKRMSGYAANLADQDANALALLQVSQFERAVYGRLLQWAQHWTHSVQLHADHCVEPLDPPVADPAVGAPDVEAEAGCSGLLKAISGTWELGPTKIKINCERFQQSFKEEVIPWVQAYADVTYNFRTGELSVFGGAKGEISGGGGKAGFKSGIYVTADRRGDIDVGWRVGPTVTVGAGPVEFEVFKDEEDLSFIGAVSATFGLD